MGRRLGGPGKGRGIRECFLAGLDYLIDGGVGESALAAACCVHRSTVNHWHLRRQVPRDERITAAVIKCAALRQYQERQAQCLKNAGDKIDEMTKGRDLQWALAYLRGRGESYGAVIEKMPHVPDSLDPTKLSRWDRKIQTPRQREVADLLGETVEREIAQASLNRLRGKVPNEIESNIVARVAAETGLSDRILYALYPVLLPLLDLPEYADIKRSADEWCREYERRAG